jgi:translation elongation factor EF-Tu-like GTPase
MFEMTVESMFHIDNHGTVLAARVQSGAVRVGDTVDVRSPTRVIRSTIAGLEIDRNEVATARVGDQVAVLLRSFSPQAVADGLELAGEPPVWKVTNLRLFEVDKPWWRFW